MTYPTSIDTFRTTQNLPGIIYDPLQTKTVFAEDNNKLSSAVIAIETELGITPKGSFVSVAAYLTYLENSLNTAMGQLEDLPMQILEAAHPVNSLYHTTSSINPATTFGFGTWVAHAPGRVIVGKASSGTFSTAGATGGGETHTHGSGSYQANIQIFTAGSRLYIDSQKVVGDGYTANTRNSVGTNATSEANGEYQTDGFRVGGTSASASSLMPYQVEYVWKRTA